MPVKKIFIILKLTLLFNAHLNYYRLLFVFLHFWSVILFLGLVCSCFPSKICYKIDGLKPLTPAFLLLQVRIVFGSTLGQKDIRLVFSDCLDTYIKNTVKLRCLPLLPSQTSWPLRFFFQLWFLCTLSILFMLKVLQENIS